MKRQDKCEPPTLREKLLEIIPDASVPSMKAVIAERILVAVRKHTGEVARNLKGTDYRHYQLAIAWELEHMS